MPIYTDAVWKPISGGSGPHVGGPAKIVHHTTEGSKAKDAFDAFRINRSDPHFTVDETAIYQHIDTDIGARALKNLGGGVQTNRDSAIQIEVVGFAHRAKSKATLRNVAKLCRWIETTHGVANSWPNGYPKVATPAGKDPGGHNRDAATWDKTSGHYGHSQVPENSHWDPAYTRAEVDFIRTWGGEEGVFSTAFDEIPETDPGLASDTSQMPDHADVGEAAAPGGDRQEAVDGVLSRLGAAFARFGGPGDQVGADRPEGLWLCQSV